MEKPLFKWMIWGYHYFRKHPHGTFDEFKGLRDPSPGAKRISWILNSTLPVNRMERIEGKQFESSQNRVQKYG